jgi:hypothetical protein
MDFYTCSIEKSIIFRLHVSSRGAGTLELPLQDLLMEEKFVEKKLKLMRKGWVGQLPSLSQA